MVRTCTCVDYLGAKAIVLLRKGSAISRNLCAIIMTIFNRRELTIIIDMKGNETVQFNVGDGGGGSRFAFRWELPSSSGERAAS